MVNAVPIVQLILAITLKSSVILALSLLAIRSSMKMPEVSRYRVALVALVSLIIAAIPLGRICTEISIPVTSGYTTSVAQSEPDNEMTTPAKTPAGNAASTNEAAEKLRMIAAQDTVLSAKKSRNTLTGASMMLSLYIAGFLVGLIRLLTAHLQLRHIFTQSVKIQPPPWMATLVPWTKRMQQVGYYTHPDVKTPFSYGIIRPIVVIPESTVKVDRDLEYIALHELTHIRRNDSLVLLIVRLLGLLHWFNPLFYIFKSQIELIMETSCDEIVVNQLGSPSHYSRILVKFLQVRRSFAAPTTAMSSRISTARIRLKILQKPKASRTRAGISRIVPVLVLALVVTPIVITSDPAPIQSIHYEGYITIPTTRTQLNMPVADISDGESVPRPQRPGDDLYDLAEFTAETGTPYFLAVNDNSYDIDGIEFYINVAESIADMNYAVLSNGNRYVPDNAENKLRIDHNAGFSFKIPPIDADIFVSLSLSRNEADAINVSAKIALREILTDEESRQYFAALWRYTEYNASNSIEGQLRYDFSQMVRGVMKSHMHQVALTTRARDMLEEILLPDPYSPTSEPYGFEAGSSHYIFISIGPDGEFGTGDDPAMVLVELPGNRTSSATGTRAGLWEPEVGWLLLATYGIDPGTRQ